VDKGIIRKSNKKRGGRMIKACEEHVDLAIDVMVDEEEVAPEINLLTEKEKLLTICEYCQNKAIYVVSNAHSDTICG
jgi:CxxH/CxxC protein (TIGR04129 family)